MNFLLDTNAVSEWMKPRPDPGLLDWFSETPEDSIFLSVVTFAELRYGIDLREDGRRKRALNAWLQVALPRRFADRIMPITADIAERSGSLQAQCRREGRSLHAMDGLIAATACIHGFSVVTRNIRHFVGFGFAVVTPWS